MVIRRATQRGVTYIALLLAMAMVLGVLAAGTSIWSQIQRREREKQLLWAGDQIRRAIVAYSQAGAAGGENYPATLQDLLLDPRVPARRRFLRRIYDDPMTRSSDWGLIRNPQGRIVGVHSRAEGAPLKTGRFPVAYASFETAATYADWRFAAPAGPRAGDRPLAPADAASTPAGTPAAGGVAAKPPASAPGAAVRPAPAASSVDPQPSLPAQPAVPAASAPQGQATPESEPPASPPEPEPAVDDTPPEVDTD
jgi:type II secretory pathway pseudopilin PulG